MAPFPAPIRNPSPAPMNYSSVPIGPADTETGSTGSRAVVYVPLHQLPTYRPTQESLADIRCVCRIVKEKLNLEVKIVEACEALDPHGSTKSYLVRLHAPTAEPGEVVTQAGTVRTPYAMRKLIVQFKSTRRMTMSDAYWATNKVAAMKLARDIIYNTPFEGAVPEVYSWYEGTDRPGDKAWVIQSAPPSDSVPLKSRFNREHEQKDILDHIAKLQRYFQAYKMPRSYGSCSFTSTGQVCAGPLQQPNLGGPFTTSRDMMKAELRRDFSRAKRHHELQGWTCEPELRQQLAEFIAHSMNTMLSTIQDCDPIFTLNKLELSNFLCDKYGGRINYIIDFSWASITHPIMEFFNSYVTMFGVLPFFPNENWAILHRAVLNGFEKKHVDVDLRGLDFLAYIQEIRDPAESYRIGRELYEAFEKAKVKTPREIKGAEAMSAFMGLCAAVGARSWSPPGASPEDVYQAKVKNLTDSLREVRKWAN